MEIGVWTKLIITARIRGNIFFFGPKQNDICKHRTKSQYSSSNFTKIVPSLSFHKFGTNNIDIDKRRHPTLEDFSVAKLKFRRDKNADF